MNRRIKYLFPLVLVSIAGTTFIQAQELTPEAFRNVLDPYVGVWQGEYRIYSQDDELLNQFKVNRNYWWDGAVLLGRVSYDFGEVKQTYFHRMILSDGIPFSFVTDTANSNEIRSALKGEFLKGTQVWARVMPKGSLPVRISERIVTSEDGKFMEFWGNQEAKDAKGESLLVRIEGFAAYVPDSRDFVVALDEVEDVSESEIEPGNQEVEPEKKGEVKNRNRRLQSLDPDRRTAASHDEAITAAAMESEAEASAPEEPLSVSHMDEKNVEPETTLQSKSKPVAHESAAIADPEIETSLNALNIVGINDKDGEQCIVVDYFLLYEIGDRLDMDKNKGCIFSGLDDQYLYFEDSNGYTYRLFRKDALPK